MKFRKDNKIQYAQDFRYPTGIPSGIDFVLTKRNDWYDLTAAGYGIVGGNYGSGCLLIKSNWLTTKQRSRFERELAKPRVRVTHKRALLLPAPCPHCGQEIKAQADKKGK